MDNRTAAHQAAAALSLLAFKTQAYELLSTSLPCAPETQTCAAAPKAGRRSFDQLGTTGLSSQSQRNQAPKRPAAESDRFQRMWAEAGRKEPRATGQLGC